MLDMVTIPLIVMKMLCLQTENIVKAGLSLCYSSQLFTQYIIYETGLCLQFVMYYALW